MISLRTSMRFLNDWWVISLSPDQPNMELPFSLSGISGSFIPNFFIVTYYILLALVTFAILSSLVSFVIEQLSETQLSKLKIFKVEQDRITLLPKAAFVRDCTAKTLSFVIKGSLQPGSVVMIEPRALPYHCRPKSEDLIPFTVASSTRRGTQKNPWFLVQCTILEDPAHYSHLTTAIAQNSA